MENLQSKVVIITGASSGIGEATAKYLAHHGARLVLAARREDRMRTIVDNILQEGGNAVYMQTDVTNAEDMQRLTEYALEKFGQTDVLINNAGVQLNSHLHELKMNEWEQTIDVNIKGVLNGIAAVLPTMRKQKSGHIINISSVMGHRIIPTTTVYSASKSAVRAISEGLRQEESTDSGIRSTIISPGMTATGVLEEYSDYPSLSPSAVSQAIAYAINQPDDANVNEIVIRPTLQTI
ncbi:SDR family oxidoreductase [Radiobacillus kanasensis]|uniref:SDR family oxidoreductase n=1 Tax=Radiobacillus kanasensis TaxID=2844358 RepID=UPI001E489D75|nr:SDR family oxidoreductase [Radiobacillus kanasensis]UFT99558.1 SDR family oxidoreductase [Radiobacillus kanasensis]